MGLGGRGLPRIGVDEPNASRIGRKASGRDYPGYAGLIEVRERIDWLDASVEAGSVDGAIQHDGADLFDRYVLPPEPDDDVGDEL